MISTLYKGQKYVDNLIEIAQRNWRVLNSATPAYVELILVNDYPEETIIIDKGVDSSIVIQVINMETNSGIHAARIAGLNRAKGEYVLFLDQDDEIKENYLSSQLSQIGTASGILCNGIYRNHRRIYNNEEEQKRASFDYNISLRYPIISPGQILLKRDDIPVEWKTNIMRHNGNDDLLLWFLLFKYKRKLTINREVLYTHVEVGENASQCYSNMIFSVQELVDIVYKNRILPHSKCEELKKAASTRIKKYESYLNVEKNWTFIEKYGQKYLIEKGIKKVAIYGMGIWGANLYHELKNMDIQVLYCIDKNANAFQNTEIDIRDPKDKLEPVNLFFVTATFAFDEIKEQLSKKVKADIISLEEWGLYLSLEYAN